MTAERRHHTGHGLGLTSTTLRTIADELEALEKVRSEITEFRIAGYTVRVRTTDSQMEGRTVSVTRISVANPLGGALRGIISGGTIFDEAAPE